MQKALPVLIVLAAVVALLAWNAAPSAAFSAGMSGHSGNPAVNFGATCGACHGGGSAPVVQLTGPANVAPGSVHTYVLTVQSTDGSAQTAAGLGVSAMAGALASLGPDTQLLDGEITHTAPKANDGGGLASFSFQWTAPNDGTQAVTLYASGNSVDLDGMPFGDAAAEAAVVVTVAEPTAVRLAGLVAGPQGEPAWGLAAVGAAMLVLAGGLVGWRRGLLR